MKVSVLCFDVSSNSFGRAWLLAQALSKFYDVEIIGPSWKGGIWTPMEQMSIPVKKFEWKRYPVFSQIAKKILEKGIGTQPMTILSLYDSPSLQKINAKNFVHEKFPLSSSLGPIKKKENIEIS